jgi:hypothetical protein
MADEQFVKWVTEELDRIAEKVLYGGFPKPTPTTLRLPLPREIRTVGDDGRAYYLTGNGVLRKGPIA